MVTWSPGDIDVEVQALLVQIYPVLLSTLLSINRQQLSTSDARFALLLSSSPLTVYLVIASIGDLCGIRTGLYKRIEVYRLITRALGALVLPLWMGLNMTFIVSTRAFKDSHCSTHTFTDWLMYIANLIIFFFESVGGIMVGVGWGLVTPWFIFLARRWSQLRAEVKFYSEGASRVRVLLTWVKCAWCVPVDVGPRLAKFNAIKVHYRPQPQVVCLLAVCVFRHQLDIPGHIQRRFRVRG